jgi:hypothetical protein
MPQIQLQLSQRKMFQINQQHKDQSNMCVECGCDKFGSETGMSKVPGGILDVTRDGEAGLTLNMTASQQERLRFINE